jgi:hypothetical protein
VYDLYSWGRAPKSLLTATPGQEPSREAAKVGGVKGKEPADSVALHGRHEADVMRPEARHAVRLCERQPELAQLIVVRQERETPLEEAHPLSRLRGRHAQAVLPSRGHARSPGCHRPEFREVLRDHDQPLASLE